MKTLLGTLIFSFMISNGWAASPLDDVGCVLSKVSGNDVNISNRPATRADCRAGSSMANNFGENAKVCAVMTLDDPHFSNSGTEARQALCQKCGYLWLDNKCVVKDEMGEMKKKLEKLEEKVDGEASKTP